MISCIIIDDEPHCIGTLQLLIDNNCKDLEITHTCRNGIEGLDIIQTTSPDLIFLDVAMPRMDGFEMLSNIEAPSFEIIFTTAYDDYAIKAFKVNAIDYLLKPIDKEELIIAVNKVVNKTKNKKNLNGEVPLPRVQSLIEYLRQDLSDHGQLAIPTLEGFQMVQLAKIFYIQSDGNYSRIHFKNDPPILVTRTLKQLEETLEKRNFIRIHRQTVVNVSHIDRYVRGDGGYVVLTNKKHLDVSRRKKDQLLNLIRP